MEGDRCSIARFGSVARLALPALALGGSGLAGAAIPAPIDPQPADGWKGVPDLDEGSGRFLVVSGLNNSALPGGPGNDPAQLVVRSCFTLPDPGDLAKIALFDGDTDGLWDQRDDIEPVAPAPGTSKPFNTVYRVYPDPTGGVGRALARGDAVDQRSRPAGGRDGDPEPGAPVSPTVTLGRRTSRSPPATRSGSRSSPPPGPPPRSAPTTRSSPCTPCGSRWPGCPGSRSTSGR